MITQSLSTQEASVSPCGASANEQFDLDTLNAVAQVVAKAETWEDVKDWLALQLKKHEMKISIPDCYPDPIPGELIAKANQPMIKLDPASVEMTEEEMRSRISMLAEEMDANDEENRFNQAEIDSLYAKIDAMKTQ
jgi:hypothetical protein